MIKPIIKLIRALQSNNSPHEIAAGVALSLFFGLTPMNSTHVLFLVLIFIFFKVNRAATVVFLPLVKLADVLGLCYVADGLGYVLLVKAEFLKPFWAFVTNAPLLTYLNLNHTRVLGGLLIAILFTPIAYWGALKGIAAYRDKYQDKMDQWKVMRWIKGLTVSKWLLTWWPK